MVQPISVVMMSFPATPEWLVTWHLWLSECLKKCAWNSGCIILSGGATWETAMEMNGNAIGYFLQELQTSWVNKLLQDIIAKLPSLRKKWHCSKTDLSWQINFCYFHSSVKKYCSLIGLGLWSEVKLQRVGVFFSTESQKSTDPWSVTLMRPVTVLL